MLSFAGSLKVFVAVEACDLRKGFNGLHALVTERLGVANFFDIVKLAKLASQGFLDFCRTAIVIRSRIAALWS